MLYCIRKLEKKAVLQYIRIMYLTTESYYDILYYTFNKCDSTTK